MAVDLEEFRQLARVLDMPGRGDHFETLGIRVTDVQRGSVTLQIDYQESLVGNPVSGVIHGGVITTLLDTCCGFSASTLLETLAVTPTIDLRIDYLRPAEPHKPVIAVGEVYHVTRHVLFTRAVAHQGDPSRPVAQAVGNFAQLEPGVFGEFGDNVRQAARSGEGES
ncbi:PaaI family thioesterase [Pseudomaricurvus sp. HS19]|uniref:PaaI family thioesterase n=1 Tax=Pseudomaricurvus sp. HS19 TaxID=2692626 RepID=UPI00136BD3E8|nr:PaaI family thioesterase [Pseudomaricurvus sp. HS19]MYM62747.1 hotdog fold thioesterase [Pseudomaricurvus sp. HS19]